MYVKTNYENYQGLIEKEKLFGLELFSFHNLLIFHTQERVLTILC